MAAKVLNLNRYQIAAGVGCAVVVGLGCYVGYRLYTRRQGYVDISDETVENGEPIKNSELESKKGKLKELLRTNAVFCKDLDLVEEIIDAMILGGVEQLQVVADFDRTMTPMHHNGAPVPSCRNVIESSPHLPQWFKDQAAEMRDYYLAIEFNPKLTRKEKFPAMAEWIEKAHALLAKTGLTRRDVVEAVEHANLYLRPGCGDLLKCLAGKEIPMLVFSAGLGDVIRECMSTRYKMYDNMHIIANWMDFNAQGDLVGFKGENVHVLNKNSHAIDNSDYFENIKHRHNVILMGDNLGDLDIAEGLEFHENLLTVGFLNVHVEESLEEYKSRYDIVLTGDPSVELIQSVVDIIILSTEETP